MKFYKLALALLGMIYLTSCASGYKMIEPQNLDYNSQNVSEKGVSLEYRYDLLPKKYAKKEKKSGIKLVAVGLKNNTDKPLTFGRDFKLSFENGKSVMLLSQEKVFSKLKQQGAYHLFYLALTPTNIYTTETRNGYTTSESVFPVGLILGPGLAGYNLLRASSANKKFKKELEEYNLNGEIINPGQEKYGLIGIRSGGYDALKVEYVGNIEVEENEDNTDVK
ncbi:hypothetical protein GCM10023115_40260 [Pontixanthobacter gangjinensis]|uniref:Lipoprotein n=1 Tax=Christiangramia aestuarii TaxID=1028746 RepID=A0A7K1LS04_9FLAO|nr:hypothetical protein [Christiangramia aestuarii]MUP43589.1 hypothetical protein [Christiangramia aestuarii]